MERIALLEDLSSDEKKQMQDCLREKQYDKGELLFNEGQSCEKIFFVKSGRVKLYCTSPEGKEQILEILNPGDSCACNPGLSAWACNSTAEAMTSCTVLYLLKQDYIRLVQNNLKLSQILNKIFADKLRRFSCLIEEISLKDVKKRLIKFLLDISNEQKLKKHDMGNAIQLTLSREEIAQRLGSTRETIIRYLYELRDEKLIDIEAKSIFLLNPNELRKRLA